MQTVTVETTQNIDIDYEVAGLGERILARLADAAIIVVVVVIFVGSGFLLGRNNTLVGIMAVVFGVLYVFYDLACEVFLNGQSFGKRILKIKVISLNGGRPTLSQYVLRWLFRIVDFSLTSSICGLICVAASQKKQRLGDMVAGTTLIKTNPRVGFEHLVFQPVVEKYEPSFSQVTQLTDKDITLINEVLLNYNKTGNSVLVYNMANRIASHLSISIPSQMNDYSFLQTIINDYNYLTSL